MSSGLLSTRDERVLSLGLGVGLVGFILKGAIGGVVGFVGTWAVGQIIAARQKGLL